MGTKDVNQNFRGRKRKKNDEKFDIIYQHMSDTTWLSSCIKKYKKYKVEKSILVDVIPRLNFSSTGSKVTNLENSN